MGLARQSSGFQVGRIVFPRAARIGAGATPEIGAPIAGSGGAFGVVFMLSPFVPARRDLSRPLGRRTLLNFDQGSCCLIARAPAGGPN